MSSSGKNQQLVVVVEDDLPLNQLIYGFLELHGFENVVACYSGEEALKTIPKSGKVIVIQDFDLPGINGIDVLQQVKAYNQSADFIFLSGQGSIDVAVEALKNGAFDYIVKDTFAKENVLLKINFLTRIRNLEKTRQRRKLIIGISFMLITLSWLLFFWLLINS